jgi:Uma2 family endonuclease
MATLILDPHLEKRFRDEYPDRFRETWDGVDTLPPTPNTEHQRLVVQFSSVFSAVIDWDRGDSCFPGANLSDRADGWAQNYRCPDVLVYLSGNPAVDHDTHWVGGPDFLVEIISEGEDPHAKFAFYAAVNTREVLVVERNPWALELFTLVNGALVSAGRSELANGLVLTSDALGLTFKLVAGSPRPKVEVTHPASGKRWVV